jgi:hypothetical protein
MNLQQWCCRHSILPSPLTPIGDDVVQELGPASMPHTVLRIDSHGELPLAMSLESSRLNELSQKPRHGTNGTKVIIVLDGVQLGAKPMEFVT